MPSHDAGTRSVQSTVRSVGRSSTRSMQLRNAWRLMFHANATLISCHGYGREFTCDALQESMNTNGLSAGVNVGVRTGNVLAALVSSSVRPTQVMSTRNTCPCDEENVTVSG